MELLKESHLLQFLLICVLTALATAKVTLQGAASRRYIRGLSDSILFNAQLFFVIAVILFFLFSKELPSWEGLLLACSAALCTLMFQVFYALALQNGPVSLSVLIVNFSVLLTSAFSIIVYREHVYLSQVVGVLLLVISMLLSVKKDENAKGVTVKWLILLFLSLIGTGGGTIFLQVFGRSFSRSPAEDNAFVIIMYAAASAMALLLYAAGALGKGKKRCAYGFWNKYTWLFVALIGVVLGAFQKFYLMGMKYVDGGFLFPTFTGMQSVAMTFSGILIFKDKLSRRQMLGIVVGIACVVMMNLRLIVLI